MNPEQAYRKLCEDKNHKDRESLEQIISEEADASYCYAIAVKQCRWELGEAAISTSAYYSYHYAVEIIGGRFVLGEAAISTSAEMSFFYSRWAIQGRLPDIMHRKMLAFGIMDSSDEWVKEYFATIAGMGWADATGYQHHRPRPGLHIPSRSSLDSKKTLLRGNGACVPNKPLPASVFVENNWIDQH